MKKKCLSSSLLVAALLAGCQTIAPSATAPHSGEHAFNVTIRAPRQLESIVTRHMRADIDHYVATLYRWDAATSAFVAQPNPVTVKPLKQTTITFGNLGTFKYQVQVVGYDAGGAPITSDASGLATVDLTGNDVEDTPDVVVQPVLLAVPFSGKFPLPAAPQWATKMEAVVQAGGKTLADVTYNPGQSATAASLAVDTDYTVKVTAYGVNGYSDTQSEDCFFGSNNGLAWLSDIFTVTPIWFNWPGYTVGDTPGATDVDPSGNVWVITEGVNSIYELSSAGSVLGTFATNASHIAIDPNSGNVWVDSNGVTELSPTGSVLGTFSTGTHDQAYLAVDSQGNVWVAQGFTDAGTNMSTTTLVELSSTGSVIGTTPIDATNSLPTGVCVDGQGNVWVATESMYLGPYGGSVFERTTAGVLLQAASDGARPPIALAADQSHGNVWIAWQGYPTPATGPNYQPYVSEISASGTIQYGGAFARAIAPIGNGDVWMTDDHSVREMFGTKRYADIESPSGLAVDSQGNAWVSSESPSPRLLKFAP